MQYKLTKILLVVVAFNTSVYFDNLDQEYGWHWGLNEANAIEIITVYGHYTGDADSYYGNYDYFGHYDLGSSGSSGSYGGYGSSGGSSGSSSDAGDNVVTNEEAIAICKGDVDQLVNTCQSTYSDFSYGVGTLCAYLTFGKSVTGLVSGTTCGTTVYLLNQKAQSWCKIQGNYKKANECK